MKNSITIVFVFTSLFAFAQDSTKIWTNGALFNLNLSQVSLSNWAAGGQNSLSATGIISAFSNYKKGTITWDNTLDMNYGILQQGKKAKVIKSDDRLELNSKFGSYAFKNYWYHSILFNFKTQFRPGYSDPLTELVKISDALSPAYMLLALGLDYKRTDFTLFMSPVTGKFTIVNDQGLADAGAYGVEKALYDEVTGVKIREGQRFRKEMGGYFRGQYKKNLMENVLVSSKLELFSNYLHNPQNIDVNWDVLISFKVNKFISASITTTLIYDDDIKIATDENKDGVIEAVGPRTQFKEVLSIGLSYKL